MTPCEEYKPSQPFEVEKLPASYMLDNLEGTQNQVDFECFNFFQRVSRIGKEFLKDVSLKSSHPCDNGYLTCIGKNATSCGITEMTDIVSALVQA
jgi:hypothetical protein